MLAVSKYVVVGKYNECQVESYIKYHTKNYSLRLALSLHQYIMYTSHTNLLRRHTMPDKNITNSIHSFIGGVTKCVA